MALFVILQTVFLLVLMHFSPCTKGSSEYLVFPTEIINVSIHSVEECLDIEWTVHLHTDILNLKMIFQIDISRNTTTNTVEQKNYTTTLKSNKTLQWCWHSALPLECTSHFVRIRSMVDDERFPESRIWSSWSPSVKSEGQDSSGQFHFFPKEKVFIEEGSNITFCCISKTDKDKIEFFYDKIPIQGIKLNSHATKFEVNNVPFLSVLGTNAFCVFNSSTQYINGTVLYIEGVLEEPKDFSCQTQDLEILNCTWDSGRDQLLPNLHRNYSLFEWFSQKRVDCNHRNWCIWQLTGNMQDMYNFTLMAENKLRKRRTNTFFNVTHQVQPKIGGKIFIKNINATEATLAWDIIPNKRNLSFLCQIEVYHDTKVIQYNTSTFEFNLRELQPYTKYSVQVRCCTANHFWKWSEWNSIGFITEEASPSGSLDVWRNMEPISGRYKVKIFWKPLPTFQANGKIKKYYIAVETLGKVLKDIFSESDSNSTEIIIDQQSFNISVAAFNSVGSSTPSVIASGDAENSMQNITEDRVNGTGKEIYLSWQSGPGEIEGYVVDWCDYPQEAICDFQWKKFSPNITNATITSDAFQPGVRYHFRIYGLSTKHEAYLLEKKTGYTKELALDCKPEVTVTKLTSTSSTLSWKDNCTDEPQNGFFQGYHIYVKPEEGALCDPAVFSDNIKGCEYTVSDTKQKTFRVENLQPHSTYNFEVKAFTRGGDSLPGITRAILNNETSPERPENTNLIMIIIFPMAFTLLLIIVLTLKIQWVKEKCFPNIPDPCKSSVLSLMNFKGNIHQAILNTSECIPDIIEIVNKSEISKTQGSRAFLIGNETAQPTYIYLLSTGKDQGGICFENFTYRQGASDFGSCSQIQMMPNDPMWSVEPSENSLKVKKDNIGSLDNIPAVEEANLNYVSQLAPTMPGDQGSSSANLPEPRHCSEYKKQMVIPTGLALSLPTEGDRSISVASFDQLEKLC
ncbi:oncostatin-M-specific receptor subunit beta isoform X2 [Macrotis lagotis]|uniref:oncostatin-M-specific receptor subunit beta isoform X2 n=1 Tax=Macrotis lagotis TaxID=92651 RepID=UPI003D6946CC